MTRDEQLSNEERHELSAASREWLRQLERGSLEWSATRSMPYDLVTLVRRGFVFHSHFTLTLTDKGRDVLERVS